MTFPQEKRDIVGIFFALYPRNKIRPNEAIIAHSSGVKKKKKRRAQDLTVTAETRSEDVEMKITVLRSPSVDEKELSISISFQLFVCE
jgi:CRISPR/Cas system CMR-associated protein Cmr1 (group 7 of RAMP superfamily)